MAWVIPIFLAYIPGLIIWFMIFTLLITRYHELPLEAPRRLARRRMAAGDDRVAAWNEGDAMCARSNTSANSHTQVHSKSSSPTTTRRHRAAGGCGG
jgi:hypothetical protein